MPWLRCPLGQVRPLSLLLRLVCFVQKMKKTIFRLPPHLRRRLPRSSLTQLPRCTARSHLARARPGGAPTHLSPQPSLAKVAPIHLGRTARRGMRNPSTAANERNPARLRRSIQSGLGISFARCEVRPPLRRRFPALGVRPEGHCCALRGWFRRSNEDAPIDRSSALRIHPGAPCFEA